MEIYFSLQKKFVSIFEAIKELTSEFTFRINNGKLTISELDSSHASMFYIDFPYQNLFPTNINETTRFDIIVNSKDFWKTLNTKGSEPITVFLYDQKNINYDNGEYNIRIKKNDQETFLIGNTNGISDLFSDPVLGLLTTKLKIGSNLLVTTLKYIEKYCPFVEFNFNSDAEFSDLSKNVRIVYKYTTEDESNIDKQIIKLEEKEAIKSNYPISYLINFLRVSKLVPYFNLEICHEMPLKLVYSAEQEFNLKFVLAPQIPEK